MPHTPSENFDLGAKKYEEGLYEEAIEYFDQATALAPNDATAYHARALANYCLEQYETALSDFDIAIRINPEDATVYINRGDAEAALGNYEGAIADYDEAIRIDPNFAPAYNGRGDKYFLLEDYEAALADYDKAIQIDPYFAEAYTNRGDTCYVLERYEAALADYDEAIRVHPDFALAYANRGDLKVLFGDVYAAIDDYNDAIRIDPNTAAAYFGRGNAYAALGNAAWAATDYEDAIRIDPSFATLIAERKAALPSDLPGKIRTVPGKGPTVLAASREVPPDRYPGLTSEPTIPDYPPQSKLVRSIHEASVAPFSGMAERLADLYEARPAPFLFRRILPLCTDIGQLQTLAPLIDDTRRQCSSMQPWLEFLQLHGADKQGPLQYYHTLALVNYYMGDPIEACRLYEQVLDDPSIVGAPLNMMGQYYFIESAKKFDEPYGSILECALEEIAEKTKGWIKAGALHELYYAGQILYCNGRQVEADDLFALAEAYLPAAYMRLPIMDAMELEPELIEAKIADLRAREAQLPPEEGYVQGFKKHFLKTDTRNYFPALQHYAHYREIRGALALVHGPHATFEHPVELWEAFDWQPEDRARLEWQLRRDALSALGRQLLERLKNNVPIHFDNPRAAELHRLETTLTNQLEQDAWASTLYDNVSDFERAMVALPDLAGKLAALIGQSSPLDAHTQLLLVEYFYQRGNLNVFEVFLMYFYIGQGLVDMPGAADKKLAELLAGPPIHTSQVKTAGALVRLIKGFWAGEGAAALESMKYDDFVAHFLSYLDNQMETFGVEKFDAQYPLEGFHDWRKKRRPLE